MLRLMLLTRTRTEVRFGHANLDWVEVFSVDEWVKLGSPHTIIVEK